MSHWFILKSVFIGAAVSVGTTSSASTPQAYNALNRKVVRSCLIGSNLSQPKIIADQASFDDRVPIELRIVEGYNKGQVIDVKLCAYDRRTGRTSYVDGKGRLGVNR